MTKLKKMVTNQNIGPGGNDTILARFKTLENKELTVGALRDAMRLVFGPSIAREPLVPQGVQPQQAVQNLRQRLQLQGKAVQLTAHPMNQNANGLTQAYLSINVGNQDANMDVRVMQGSPTQFVSTDPLDDTLANLDLKLEGKSVDPNNRTRAGLYARPGKSIKGRHTVFGDGLGTATPILAVVQQPGSEPQMYFRSCTGIGHSAVIEDLEKLQAEGFEVKSIVSGTHVTNNPAQYHNALAMHDYATQLNVDFGMIDFQDQNQGSWWVRAERVARGNVDIFIGNG